MSDKQKRKKQRQKAQSGNNAESCLWDGCYFIDFSDGCYDFDGGCFGFGDNDGCIDLDFDGGCFDGFDGRSMMLIMQPFRVLVIWGLMIYGDWDYRKWRAKD